MSTATQHLLLQSNEQQQQQQQATSNNIERLSKQLMRFVHRDDLRRAKKLMQSLSAEVRAEVSRVTHEEGHSPLFLASVLGRALFVNFLLEECGSDVEQRGTHVPHCLTIESRHHVTPLWSAAVEGHVEVVKTLIQHAADVNAQSDTGMTPVFSVLQKSRPNKEMVRCLVENGCNVNMSEPFTGITCLMLAVGDVELCKYLVEHGASLTAADCVGAQALHWAIGPAGNVDTVRMLLNYGADPFACNYSGHDALQFAAVSGDTHVVEFLLQKLKPTAKKRADTYSLLAALSACHGDNDKAMDFWTQSVNIRIKEIGETDDMNLNNGIQVLNISSLHAIAGNAEAMLRQAVVVYAKLLGPHSHLTEWAVSKHNRHLITISTYQHSAELSKRVVWLCYTTSGVAYVDELKAIVKLIYSKDYADIRLDDVYYLLEMSIAEMRLKYRQWLWYEHGSYPMMEVMKLSIHLVQLVLHLATTATEKSSLRHIVHTLINMKPPMSDGRTVIHLAVDSASSLVNGDKISELPSRAVVQYLLQVGANVNEADSAGNTPLHVVAFNQPKTPGSQAAWLEVVDLLLCHGAHVNIPNAKNEVAVNFLLPAVKIFHYMSLKCLAACAIRAHRLQYRGVLPTTLGDFVDMH